MDSEEYVRIEVADVGAGGEVVLMGYFVLAPQEEESWFRTVDDYLFSLAPHKVTFRSESLGVLCSRYTLPLSLVGLRFRKEFLRQSLLTPNLEHAHRLEVETLLERLKLDVGAKNARGADDAPSDADEMGKGVTFRETRGYWGQLADR